MNRTKFFIGNSAAMALKQAVIVLVGLIVPRLIILSYGSEINGLIVSATQFITYLLLVEAGISGATIYSLYKPLALNDKPGINAILSAAHKNYLQTGFIYTALVIILALVYPLFLKDFVLSFWQVSVIILSIGVTGAFEFFDQSKYKNLLFADQKSYVLSFAQIVFFIVTLIIVVVFAKLNINIVLLQIALISPVFIRAVMLRSYSKTQYPYLDFKAPQDKDAIKDRWNVLYQRMLSGIQTSAPVILATVFTSLKEVSVFAVYSFVIAGIYSILNIFTSGLSSGFGEVIITNQRAVLQRAYQEFEQFYYIAITVFYSCALLLIMPFIKLYTAGMTDVNYILPVLGVLFVFNGILNNIKTPQGMLIVSAGMYKQTRLQAGIQAGIAVLGSIALAPFFGLYGIIAAFIASNLYRAVDMLFFVPKNITKLSPLRSLKRMLLVLFNFALACIIFAVTDLQCESILQWLICGTAIFLISLIWVIFTNIIFDFKTLKRGFARISTMIDSYSKKQK